MKMVRLYNGPLNGLTMTLSDEDFGATGNIIIPVTRGNACGTHVYEPHEGGNDDDPDFVVGAYYLDTQWQEQGRLNR